MRPGDNPNLIYSNVMDGGDILKTQYVFLILKWEKKELVQP